MNRMALSAAPALLFLGGSFAGCGQGSSLKCATSVADHNDRDHNDIDPTRQDSHPVTGGDRSLVHRPPTATINRHHRSRSRSGTRAGRDDEHQ